MLSPFGESTKSIYSTHVGERLFKHKKGISRPEKTAADALVSDLPSDTLRWIKKRRNVDCKQKVVLSHHRERQLREIFNGIDVEKRGEINIAQLEEGCYRNCENDDYNLKCFVLSDRVRRIKNC